MYKLCKTEQSSKRQREIERALFKILHTKDYCDVTITEICELLSMPRKTFYRYFDSKDDALHALIEHMLAEFSEFDIQISEQRTLKKEITNFYLFWYNNKELLDILEKNSLTQRLVIISVDFPLSDVLNIAKFLPDETDWQRDKIFKFAICGIVTQMIDWYREDFKTNISDMVDITCRMLSKPLFPYLDDIGISTN